VVVFFFFFFFFLAVWLSLANLVWFGFTVSTGTGKVRLA